MPIGAKVVHRPLGRHAQDSLVCGAEDGKYIVFSDDAFCEYDDEEAFDEGRASNSNVLAKGDEDCWVVEDGKCNKCYQNDEYEVGCRVARYGRSSFSSA